MAKYYFKDGEEVFHKDCLDTKLIVNRILKESIKIKKGIDKNGDPIVQEVIRMIGIECHWWEYNEIFKEKQLRTFKFHSNEIVPIFVAEKGIEAVKEWLNNNC